MKALGFKVDFHEITQVEDTDGNMLRLGSEPKPNQPFGPWRDMRGDLWEMTPGGEWVRTAERY